MKKSNAQLQAEYRARRKELGDAKKITVMISVEAKTALDRIVTSKSKTMREILEGLILTEDGRLQEQRKDTAIDELRQLAAEFGDSNQKTNAAKVKECPTLLKENANTNAVSNPSSNISVQDGPHTYNEAIQAINEKLKAQIENPI